MISSVSCQPFGILPSGFPIERWTLRGAGGLVLEFITYGGIVTRLLAPDRTGSLQDVVLGFNHLDSYLAGHPYFGAIVGRVAGRITAGTFQIRDHSYQLSCNQAPNHLHGGISGFDKKIWSVLPLTRADGAPSVRLSYQSPDGEEGYPGTVEVAVTYTVMADNTFRIETEAAADRPTPFSLTHHCYFNLAGEAAGSIANHELQIFSNACVEVDEFLTLLDRRQRLSSYNDFRQARRMGDCLLNLFQNHGDLYLLCPHKPDPDQEPRTVAHLWDRCSGRMLTVSTTQGCLQLYTGSGLDGTLIGKSGIPYGPYAGLCLECEDYPNVNATGFGSRILHPGEILRHITTYAFSTSPPSEIKHRV